MRLKKALLANRLRSEAVALGICEQQALATQLLAQHSVLLLNEALLAAINPSGEEQHQDLNRQRVHGVSVR